LGAETVFGQSITPLPTLAKANRLIQDLAFDGEPAAAAVAAWRAKHD
jgi:hypothetical protein